MLQTTIFNTKFESCLLNAAGCHCSTYTQMDELSESRTGAIVSKSGTIISRSGNPHPRLYLDSFGSINSAGLPNPGYQYYSNYQTHKPYIQSIYPFNITELETMLKNIKTGIIEINLSCPNVNNIHYWETYEKYFDIITQLRSNQKIGIKINHTNNFQELSHLLLKNNIDFITCCNTVPGLIVNHETESIVIHRDIGGIGGKYIKPFSLATVYNFHKNLHDKIDIIGCGGVSTGLDAFEYLLSGAKAVQVGTQLLREGIGCFSRIETELSEIMQSKGYDNIECFRGRLAVCAKL